MSFKFCLISVHDLCDANQTHCALVKREEEGTWVGEWVDVDEWVSVGGCG
jgi:hypothetical protein